MKFKKMKFISRKAEIVWNTSQEESDIFVTFI